MVEMNKYPAAVRGKVEVRLTGREPERLIRLCGNSGIELRRLRKQGEREYYFTIWADEFVKLRPFLKKTHCRARITAKDGTPFYLKRQKKRWLFPVGLLLGTVCLFMVSQFIWKIDIEGNERYTDDTIYRFLETQNIAFGTLKSSVFAAGLEEAIRDQFPEITWVSVQLSGTKMTVNVKEDDQPKVAESDKTPCHVISTQNGVITSIVVRSGETEVKQGDPITAGQILIFGEVNLKDDGGNITDTKVVHADGEVYAKVTYRYSDCFSLAHEVRTYQEDAVKQYALRVGNYRFALPRFGKLGENYDVITEKSQLYLGSDFYFPCYLETSIYRNYELVVGDYSKEAAETLANERMENYLKKLEENGYEIESAEITVTIDGQTVLAEGEFDAISQVGEKEILKDE